MCMWRISARSNRRIKLTFDVFNVEYTKLCQFDYIEIRNGKHRSAPFIGRYCGNTIPREIYSTGRFSMATVKSGNYIRRKFGTKIISVDSTYFRTGLFDSNWQSDLLTPIAI